MSRHTSKQASKLNRRDVYTSRQSFSSTRRAIFCGYWWCRHLLRHSIDFEGHDDNNNNNNDDINDVDDYDDDRINNTQLFLYWSIQFTLTHSEHVLFVFCLTPFFFSFVFILEVHERGAMTIHFIKNWLCVVVVDGKPWATRHIHRIIPLGDVDMYAPHKQPLYSNGKTAFAYTLRLFYDTHKICILVVLRKIKKGYYFVY